MREHPDVTLGVARILDAAGFQSILMRNPDDPLPHVHVFAVGGPGGDDLFRTRRVVCSYYGPAEATDAGGDGALAAANLIVTTLQRPGGHWVPGVGHLDSVSVESEPTPIPYADAATAQVDTSFVVATRPL